uniref:UmuC domain-containing protein n=1 Tax=Globisporangium ultimum (strain ATCC 200006 / CBS 805.95 / DAOM BR144) TaxID=431595 RepID=K3W5C8_GLOUD
MDCFFVAVAVRERPELQNVPVAVAHSGNSGTSEVSSCNYLARAKGVRAGMYMQIAKELCPELVVLQYKFEEIEQVSFQIYHIFFSHTPHVQAMSCDEALLEFGADTDGMEEAARIRSEILAQTRCPASVGVSYNILLAKMASKEAKPDGIYQIASPEQAEPFLLSLQIGDLPAVGRQMSAKLGELGLESIPQLWSFSKSELARYFGKNTSDMLVNFARGVDTRPLSTESNMMRKSVSAVVNFGIRFDKWEDATAFLLALAEELQTRLRSLKVQTQCVTLLIKKRREGEPLEPSKVKRLPNLQMMSM